jgi:hypothetical protein
MPALSMASPFGMPARSACLLANYI